MSLVAADRPPRTTPPRRAPRRSRRLRFALLAAAGVYLAVVGGITLLPVPAQPWRCVPPELDPTTVLSRIVNGGFGGPVALRNNGALVQFLENIAMFVPVGVLLVLAMQRRRLGLVVALVAGAALSLLIELTQATGDWGAVRCAYRAFDVSDLLANTAGAVIGALVAAGLRRAVLRRLERR